MVYRILEIHHAYEPQLMARMGMVPKLAQKLHHASMWGMTVSSADARPAIINLTNYALNLGMRLILCI